MTAESLKVALVGSSGAGKTIFLSSIYAKFRIPGDGFYSFYLKPEKIQQAERLNKLYATICSPQESWPERTDNIKEWLFGVYVKSTAWGISFKGLDLTFIDCVGQKLLEPKYIDEIRDVNAYLGIIDGEKILKSFLSGQLSQALIEDLGHIITIAQETTSYEIPVQIVLTKWDLFKREGIDFNRVEEFLKQDSTLSQFLAYREELGLLTTLIHISSLGEAFVKPSASDGSMIKVSGKQPEPYNIEMPLACILLDCFQQLKYKRRAEARKKFGTFIGTMPDLVLDFLGMLSDRQKQAITNLWKLYLELEKNDEKLEKSGVVIGDNEKLMHLSKSLERVRNERTSAQHIMRCFWEIQRPIR